MINRLALASASSPKLSGIARQNVMRKRKSERETISGKRKLDELEEMTRIATRGYYGIGIDCGC